MHGQRMQLSWLLDETLSMVSELLRMGTLVFMVGPLKLMSTFEHNLIGMLLVVYCDAFS